jgi:RsiW-degrading membrane proteinase PrsW (M82 family)
MNGLWILFLLIFISALPVFAVYLWFRRNKYPLSLPWILWSLLGGIIALLAAGLLQSLFPPDSRTGLGVLFFKIFVQIALTEEAGRLAVLFVLFWLARRLANFGPITGSLGAAMGLFTGLGFAVVETASYGAVNLGIALLRAVTAAPLHGACGARVGVTAAGIYREPLRALLRFFSAVAIHGMYNLMILSPGVPAFLSVLIAFAALISSLQMIRAG